jgi:hypothetical protein
MAELVIPLRVTIELELAMLNLEHLITYDNQVTRQHMGTALVMCLGRAAHSGGYALSDVVPNIYRDSREYYGDYLDIACKDVHKIVRHYLQNTVGRKVPASEVWEAVEKAIQKLNL